MKKQAGARIRICDYYKPQPKQQEFHESQARRSAREGKRGII